MGINPLAARVENEVVAMGLARRGLDSFKPGLGDIIPSVYGFCARPDREGDLPWVVMEVKSGVGLDEVFGELEVEMKDDVMGQVADVFAGLRCAVSLGGVGGGVTRGEPWGRYEDLLKGRLRHELGDAEKSVVIRGWKGNGVRERLEGLIERFTLSESGLGLGLEERVLVHGDFTMNNILIDPTTNKLTALLDFDFACIAHPAHEFLVSLQDLGGNIMGPYGEDPTEGKLSQALLSGDFSEDVSGDLWWIGKTLNEKLKERGVRRPCDMMPGMKVLKEWRALEQLICPFHLAAPFIVQKMTEEQRMGARMGAEEELVAQMEVLDGLLGGRC
ncbi:hypothetical protein BO94DRAFT_620035 [Aspergillus sclerotioniger CBS 115572]|uniref:non-specific serine/threonine protein kinase n=1 Tax=Aspergillus sclerotioniger CBS 115572 TaxID=1450535 RepID=A0A317XD47_9EURO|nr:hypothetical protein BO94DRAFT_620035 [Aspergillus sclerotioniger CBS 115572]PWY95632.1 hypothetical protein BO94DRAFT_620035 [Aspergillus sclerotioniger CBS 115572]